MGTASLMDALEDTCMEGPTDTADEQDGDVNAPTQLAVMNQEPPLIQGCSQSAQADSSNFIEISTSNDPDTAAAPGSMKSLRQVDIINVPKPKGRGRPRTTLKQLRQTKLPDRIALHSYPSNLTVSLDHGRETL